MGDTTGAEVRIAVEIVELVASPVHAFEGRPADGPRPDPEGPRRDRIEVRAGLGVVGDRYFNHPAHRRAAVTLLSAEALDAVATEVGTPPFDPVLTRRTVVLRGAAMDALAGTGAEFALDSGDGPVRLRAHRAAHPCRWMDVVLAPGAFKALRGRGGVRCEPLSDGVLRRGAAALTLPAVLADAVVRH
ncbi:molybdenum cofactor biosysynthesis protein [Pseudonocardia kujensis]|uniref:molybdenum cofactor biosysynthesis protein n=1 Tax=Pseudonocardia kujensis TaxID=1128675 RepID=UPI001E47C431|nr:molybdenum cofactor biosysynthesis protein [Pseudonocardia kujensis]MCE0767509.1 molybdenum cofactor biosysynthesis protein [Pseudonocardia kujensis]